MEVCKKIEGKPHPLIFAYATKEESSMRVFEILIFSHGIYSASRPAVYQSGIFATWEGKSFRQCEKQMKFGANGLEFVEFQRTQNPKFHPPIPIWDLDARVAGEQRICLHWDLASRLEMKLEIPLLGEEK
ncbi:hypothetical protein AVEN_120150-1 [Araneus ventricosus]|uniref:Uncharacterized protein n=1 Tax=Araneus ventricosus TaxID=182803 RepID=A0A4Y2V741_ARAVE|nr:hypothetical protein AVEN_120150-1 [Araneus ventricosus]